MKNEKYLLFTVKSICYKRHVARQMSPLSIQTKLDSLFKLAPLRSKTNIASEYSVDECMYCLFMFF
jgi:hypothetical protein